METHDHPKDDVTRELREIGPRVLEAWSACARPGTPGPAARAEAWEQLCVLAGEYADRRARGEIVANHLPDELIPSADAPRLQAVLQECWPLLPFASPAGSPGRGRHVPAADFITALSAALFRVRMRRSHERLRRRYAARLEETQEATRVFRALFTFSRDVAGAMDLESTRAAIVEGAGRVLNVRRVCLYEPDATGEHLVHSAGTPGWEPSPQSQRLQFDSESMIVQAFLQRRSIAAQGDRPGEAAATARDCEDAGVLYVPLLGPDGAHGILALGPRSDRPTPNRIDTDAALAFAGHAALALANATYSAHSRATHSRWAALVDVCRVVSSSLDRDTILRRIVEHAVGLSEASGCTMFLLDAERQELYPVAANESEYVDEIMAVRLKLGEGITGDVARSGRAEIVPNAIRDPRARQVENTPIDEDECLCCVPLVSKDRVLGVMTLGRRANWPFQPEDLQLLTILAHHGSVAIENARLYGDARAALRELEEAQQHLVRSERLNAFGQVASGVAHDFNNLLAAILGRTQLMLMRVEDARTRSGLEVIEQTARDGVQTVRRIQEFTRVRRDQHFTPVDLAEVVRSGMAMLLQTVNARNPGAAVEVTTELQEVPTVDGSPSELREVLTNLILNALDAMPEGGRLTVRTRLSEGLSTLEVEDTGTGMTAEVMARVFDPFYTTKKSRGTGLGLSVALGIAERHHGVLTVESEPGQGSLFRLALPPGSQMSQPVGPRILEEPHAKVRVLVVDDEPSVLEVLRDMLLSEGHEVIMASDGAKALDLLRSRGADVILTDLGMPGLNGWQVAQAAKKDFPGMPVVLVTGWGVQLDPAEAQSRCVDFVVAKPFEMSEVLSALGMAIKKLRRAA